MNESEQRAAIMEFEKNRQLLGNISMQKQQMQMQAEVYKASIEELKDSKEATVMKVVGNIIVNKDRKDMEKELKDKVESLELRVKTMERQEEMTIKKLNVLKTQIEGTSNNEKEAHSSKSSEKKKSKK
jgi:prefoldin beta subunit